MVALDSNRKSYGAKAQILASATSGFMELLIFHPIDTIGKRLINHRGSALGSSPAHSLNHLASVIFNDSHNKGPLAAYRSLFPGFKFAVLYKVSQRTFQFGGHPLVREFMMTTSVGDYINNRFGKRKGKTIIHAVSGFFIGLGEVCLLPLDALKVKRQTTRHYSKIHANIGKDPTTMSAFSSASHTSPSIRFISSSRILETTGALYRGASWTAARNSLGCVALFGAAAAVKDVVFQIDDEIKQATMFQNFCASVAGAIASIIVASPLDVIKVRVQAAPLDRPLKGYDALVSLIRNEGLRALYKGIVPKLLVSAPKVTFSFTVAQQIAPLFANLFGISS